MRAISNPQRPRRRAPMALVAASLMVPTILAVPFAAAAPPPNDDFNNATVIPSLPYSNSQDTRNATVAADDPCSNRDKTVWYNFTATSDTFVRVNATGSNFDAVIAIVKGPRGAFTSTACATDNVAGESSVGLTVRAGETVHIMAGARAGGAGGDLVLNVASGTTPTPPPPPPPPPSTPLALEMVIDSPVKYAGNRATITGVGQLDRTMTGTLCVHARMQQSQPPTINFGSAYRCFAVDGESSIPWNLDVRGSRAWRTGSASVTVYGHFYTSGAAASDTSSRTVAVVPG